jgi:outer membrane immunogenic protein
MNLKKLILGTVVALSPGLALAADLPTRQAAPAPMLAAAPFSWSGFYVGLNAGGGVAFNDAPNYGGVYTSGSYAEFGIAGSSRLKHNSVGALGGLTMGFNQQLGVAVIGLEADIAGAKLSGKANDYIQSGGDFGGDDPYAYFERSIQTKISAFGTLRGRLGLAFDKGLVYATGGLAFGRVKTQLDAYGYAYAENGEFDNYNSSSASLTSHKWRVGWTAGAGVEYAINRNWSLKAEGLYFDLGKENIGSYLEGDANFSNNDSFGVIGAASNRGVQVRTNGVVGRMGLNYRF